MRPIKAESAADGSGRCATAAIGSATASVSARAISVAGIGSNLATAGPDIHGSPVAGARNMFCRPGSPLEKRDEHSSYTDVAIAVPVSPRLKMRLQRAVVQGIMKPTGALPTLRRAVITASDELRHAGYTDASIGDALEMFV